MSGLIAWRVFTVQMICRLLQIDCTLETDLCAVSRVSSQEAVPDPRKSGLSWLIKEDTHIILIRACIKSIQKRKMSVSDLP
jgi:hypothetical protein